MSSAAKSRALASHMESGGRRDQQTKYEHFGARSPDIQGFLGVLFRSYAEPHLRASQFQLDKNAEPPWDPDPYC
ncbi:hypothetical protein NECAME_15225 [Necator americanus]|uniref:Uncharacterized protein n=1 Tax=Necator americanus TaxID=51031 RepID=W2SJ17_NECAM|nr:hypothetical protein NECAME_15225 [Necator americanus]ETN69563.1 hypothetical protein NECAME_15225 [Necator americanus]